MTQLTEHFSLAEMTVTGTGLPNEPGPIEVRHLATLCKMVLEPVRAHYNKPVKVNSGFRGHAVNQAVGSSETSQHRLGEAADIEVPGVSNYDLAVYIRDHLPFDQLILEAYTPGNPSSGWVHVSYRAGRLRGKSVAGGVLTMIRGSHGNIYKPGIVA